MHPVTNLFLVFTLLHLSSPFKIPENATSGYYAVTISPSGNEIHTLLSPSTNPPNQKRNPSAGWPPNPKTYCGDSYIEASDFTAKVLPDFQSRCDRTNQEFLKGSSAMAVYSLHGTAVAYMCNFSNHGNPCSSAEFVDSVRKIQETCRWSQGAVLQTGETFSVYSFKWLVGVVR